MEFGVGRANKIGTRFPLQTGHFYEFVITLEGQTTLEDMGWDSPELRWLVQCLCIPRTLGFDEVDTSYILYSRIFVGECYNIN